MAIVQWKTTGDPGGNVGDPMRFTQDTGIKLRAEDLINSPQAAQPNTAVLFKSNPSTPPGSCQHGPPHPARFFLLKIPSFSSAPSAHSPPPSQVCIWLPLLVLLQALWATAASLAKDIRVFRGSLPGALAWQSQGLLTTFLPQICFSGFLPCLWAPSPQLWWLLFPGP